MNKALLIPIIVQTNGLAPDIKALERLLKRVFQDVEVKRPLPFDSDGPVEIIHEMDYEPTYITPKDSHGDAGSIIIGAEVTQEIRGLLSPVLKGVLNADCNRKAHA